MPTPHRFNQLSWLLAAVLFVASLLLYLSTLAPSVATLFDDSLEFQLVTYQLGIAHPTGYPLYTLLGKLFTFLPVGNVAYRVNLMSAVFGAATVALLYRLILQVAPPRNQSLGQPAGWPTQLGGLIGAALLAGGLVFWQQATIAEVYTLNALFMVLLLLVATAPATRQQRPAQLLGLAFLSGLALTHHRSILLLLPALLLYLLLLYGRTLFKPTLILTGLLLGLLPLLLYLYLPLRGHVGSLDGSYQNSWSGFWQHVTASGYGQFIFDNPFGHERDMLFYWRLVADQLYTTVPALTGLLYLARLGRRQMLLLTGLAGLTYLGFNLSYNVTDIEVFFIPIFLLGALWSGLGAAFLLGTAARLPYPAWRRPVVALLLALFGVMIGQLLRSNWPVVANSYGWEIHDYGLDILQQPRPSEQSTLVGILGEMTLVRYFQQTEGLRPTVETVAADAEAERLAAVEERLAAGQTVYLTRELPGAAGRWSLGARGPLIRVKARPFTSPPEMMETQLVQGVTPEIKLRGYQLSRPPHTGPGPAPLRLTVWWQVDRPPPADWKVSARLLGPEGQMQAVVDVEPVHFAYPTSAWRAGEVVADVYDLTLPADGAGGTYHPVLIWYDPAQGAAEVGRVELPAVAVGKK